MFRRKKPQKNYRKGTKFKRYFGFLRRLAIGFNIVAGMAALMATSCFFILVYDVITQCDYFRAKSLEIEGLQRLTAKQIVEQARVNKGMNILAVNLALVRKRLIMQPWIAEAEVRREIPSGLHIRIKEHSALAIIDLGRKYIIDEEGKIFKEWTAADPGNLPLVSGLELTDFRVQGKTIASALQRPTRHAKVLEKGRRHNTPYEAVMQVLHLGKRKRSILPNRTLKQIRVDREIGITLEAGYQLKTIVLGYHNYPLKYALLKNILAYRKQKQRFPDFDRIDLNDVNRIVVNPVQFKIAAGDHKEV